MLQEQFPLIIPLDQPSQQLPYTGHPRNDHHCALQASPVPPVHLAAIKKTPEQPRSLFFPSKSVWYTDDDFELESHATFPEKNRESRDQKALQEAAAGCCFSRRIRRSCPAAPPRLAAPLARRRTLGVSQNHQEARNSSKGLEYTGKG